MNWKEYEKAAMARALALAKRGGGAVEPNPMVGAVIVKNGRIVAEGYHRRFGGPHAEVEALRKAGRRARGAEVFVSLEPCSHFGKTPPCTDALIKAGVKRVVAAMRDPFPKVRGRGLARLRRAGVRVDVGLLAEEARRLNAPYIKLRTRGLPNVILKYAMTADGRIATAGGESRWISCEESRKLAHRLRGRVDAVIVGIETALKDDPLLTARPPGKRTPARIVIDSRARLSPRSNLAETAGEFPLIVAATAGAPARRVEALKRMGAEVIILPGKNRVDLAALVRELGRREMTNVLVEGGAAVIGGFLAAGLADEAVVFVAPKLLGEGKSPVSGWRAARMKDALSLREVEITRTGCDVVLRGRLS